MRRGQMISKKYASDYNIEYDENSGGKLKARAVYSGKYYAFKASDSEIKKAAILFSVLASISWLSFIIPLFVISSAAHSWFIIIPHACVFIPLIYLSAVAWDLWRVVPPLTREKSDHISFRAPKAALFAILFSGIATAGFPIHLALHDPLVFPGDFIFGLCEITLLINSIILFRKKDLIASNAIGS